MGALACLRERRYAVTVYDMNLVLTSSCGSARKLTTALLAAITDAKALPDGGYDITGVTSLFTDYKDVMAWPLTYRVLLGNAVRLAQFHLCLPGSAAVMRCSATTCVVDIGTHTKFIRVSTNM
jgi:hypothetical protein